MIMLDDCLLATELLPCFFAGRVEPPFGVTTISMDSLYLERLSEETEMAFVLCWYYVSRWLV